MDEYLAVGLQFFFKLLYQIGPLFLFTALILGIVGLPIPDELIIIGSGVLVAHGKLNLTTTIIAAIFGSMCGITVSYLIGKLIGFFIIKKYGEKLNLTPDKIATTKKWFQTFGKWVLFFGYFIPFFRHLVGFVAGLTKLKYSSFALYAYSGAVIWSMTFFSLGYFFSNWFNTLFTK